MTGTIFMAKGLLPRPDVWVEGGGLLVVNGRVERVLETAAAIRRAATESGASLIDLGDVLIAPGMVNAHAHLELSGIAGKLALGMDMLAWIRGVIKARNSLPPGLGGDAATRAAKGLLAGGTTCVGDIDSSGGEGLPSDQCVLRRLAFREVLDGGDPRRTAVARESIELPLANQMWREEGLSAHAPHTVSAALLSDVARIAASRALPVQVHWSETREEIQWLTQGSGPFGELLTDSPHLTGLELLARAGLLHAPLSLVHGNYPGTGEPELLATNQISLVHCPGSHAYFEREPFPLAQYLAAGVTMALGTDSLASNAALDMRREMRLLHDSFPELEAGVVWEMATLGGATALGLKGLAGELSVGARADFFTLDWSKGDRRQALDWLTRGDSPPKSVWIRGAAALEET